MTRNRPVTPQFSRRKWTGFTLLEMLVVMTLLSIIMVAMVSAMRSAGQSSERVDARLAMQDDDRLAERFVRGTLGRVSARGVIGGNLQASELPKLGSSSTGLPPPLFAGAPDQISWVGVLPARYSAGGRCFFHLGVESVNGMAALVLRYVPWDDQPSFPDWSGAASQVLLTGVTGIAIQYENSRPANMDADSEWESAWSHPDYLPARAVIDIQREAQAPLQWVVPMWQLPMSNPRSGVNGSDEVIGGTQ